MTETDITRRIAELAEVGVTVGPEVELLVADLLDAAADSLLAYGWTKETLGAPLEPRCAWGALYWTSIGENLNREDTPNMCVYRDRLISGVALPALARAAGLPYVSHVPVWNDAIASDEGEVVDALRHAAKELRG